MAGGLPTIVEFPRGCWTRSRPLRRVIQRGPARYHRRGRGQSRRRHHADRGGALASWGPIGGTV